MSNIIKRTVVALAVSAAALGAGAGVASAAQDGGPGGWFNAGVGGVQLFGTNNTQTGPDVGNGGKGGCFLGVFC